MSSSSSCCESSSNLSLKSVSDLRDDNASEDAVESDPGIGRLKLHVALNESAGKGAQSVESVIGRRSWLLGLFFQRGDPIGDD